MYPPDRNPECYCLLKASIKDSIAHVLFIGETRRPVTCGQYPEQDTADPLCANCLKHCPVLIPDEEWTKSCRYYAWASAAASRALWRQKSRTLVESGDTGLPSYHPVDSQSLLGSSCILQDHD